MKNQFYLLASTSTILLFLIYIIGNNSTLHSETKQESNLTPDEWLYAQKVFPYDKVDLIAQRNAIQYVLDCKQILKNLKVNSEDDWSFIGPTVIGGRIADIEIPYGSETTIYVGTASGGVLKSYDQGNSWLNIFDGNESLSIGDMAIDPIDTNIIYVGTGETDCGIGSVTYDGNGIYKSLDGGMNWENIGLMNSGNTGRIAINPLNTQIIFAAMLGNLFENNIDRGIYRSENGGETWEKVLFINDSTGGIDVAINQQNPSIVYASTWQRVRRHNRRDYAGPGSRIYKSTDGGTTWSMLTTGLPSGELSKITLALSPSDPEIIYAGIVGSTDNLKGIYKSTNSGTSWVNLNAEVSMSSDFWYAGIKVSPVDPNEVYWIGFQSSRSYDGGINWNLFATSSHVDHQAFYISPINETFKILGSDGGLNFTFDNFSTYTLTQNIPVTQLYTIDVHPNDTSLVLAGAQDNGSFYKSGISSWDYVNGGDGVSVKWIPVDESSYYANYQYGNYYGYVDGINQPLIGFDYSDRYNWRSPIEINPLNPKTIYFAGSKMYRSNNYGFEMQTISDDLTNGNQGLGLTFGTIFTIHNAIADTNYIYVGTDDANVWRSKDYGDTWQNISDGLPYRYCMNIKTDPLNAEVVYAVFSGFRWADNVAHVYKSINGGDSWENISNDLPDIPVNDILIINHVEDSNSLVIATDVGCFVSHNDGLNWEMLGTNMPMVSVYEIYFDTATQYVFAGTYGRGAWKILLPKKIVPVENITISDLKKFQAFPNPFNQSITVNNSDQEAIIILYNLFGKVLEKKVCPSTGKIIFETENLPSGIYFIEMNNYSKRKIMKMIKS